MYEIVTHRCNLGHEGCSVTGSGGTCVRPQVRKGPDVQEDFAAVDSGWLNRSSFSCQTCIWFVMKGESGCGRCRRHAPTLGGYPVVYVDNFCGDHKLR
jgi:hypothetical protein